MKIQCNVCEAAEAKVLCCADEAALCWECDDKVHAANKLASKHQRVPLSSSSTQMPKCDICQETAGFFFCLQDRALLCRKCDVAIHTANTFVSAHQRFLLTGVKVGLEAANVGTSSATFKSTSGEKKSETKSPSVYRKSTLMPLAGVYKEVLPANADGMEDCVTTRLSFTGGSAAGSIPTWQIDEFLGLPEFNQNYEYMDNGSSKTDTGKCGDSDGSPILRSAEEELDNDEYLGHVPESSWAVPQIPSPPTASGLYWPKSSLRPYDTTAFVPDIYSTTIQDPHHDQHHGPAKRPRWEL
ncbi:B-box zinc finger protein 22-like [Mangifera indica]|uniref:B-box zinc finger protein 22-like n=1 Tax=Mangifera indica TaxID=29780 RepID=UPI001CFB0F3C|nr:B-box zinc finger protein 22-like [Mangifera indica]